MDRSVGVRKTRDNRDMSNNALISSDYLKLVCDFKSILKYDCNSEEIIEMNPKVAVSFTIVLTLAMMLSANPAMIMSSNIFASPSDGGSSDGGSSDGGSSDGGSSDGGSSDGDDGSSENEQSEVESEPGVSEEETEPETEPELVNCPNGSQAATTEECGTGTGTSITQSPSPSAGPSAELPNVLWGDYFYTNPCQSNPTDPACKSSTTTGTTTGSPSGSIPGDSGSVKNDICTTSPEAPFCKSQTIIGTIDDTPAATLLLPYFEVDLDKDETTTLFPGNNPVCLSNPTDPACKSSTTQGTTTTPTQQSTTSGWQYLCLSNPTDPACK